MARVSRPLCRRQGADPTQWIGRPGARRLCVHCRFCLGSGPAPRSQVHHRTGSRHRTKRVRRPDAQGARALRQRCELSRDRRHRVHVQRGLLQLASGRHGHQPLSRIERSLQSQPSTSGSTSARSTPRSGPRPACRREGTRAANPGWDWTPVPSADGLAFQTAPFSTATTVAGPATLVLWVKAPAQTEDLQATITEVQPQTTQEEYITSGFLRSSNQVDVPDSTVLFTDPTYLGSQGRSLSPTATRSSRSRSIRLCTPSGPAPNYES